MDGNDPQWRWREKERKVNSSVKIHSFMWDNIEIDVHTVQSSAYIMHDSLHNEPELSII